MGSEADRSEATGQRAWWNIPGALNVVPEPSRTSTAGYLAEQASGSVGDANLVLGGRMAPVSVLAYRFPVQCV